MSWCRVSVGFIYNSFPAYLRFIPQSYIETNDLNNPNQEPPETKQLTQTLRKPTGSHLKPKQETPKARKRETKKPINQDTQKQKKQKPRDPETEKPRNPETQKPRDPETQKPRDPETKNPRNRGNRKIVAK